MICCGQEHNGHCWALCHSQVHPEGIDDLIAESYRFEMGLVVDGGPEESVV